MKTNLNKPSYLVKDRDVTHKFFLPLEDWAHPIRIKVRKITLPRNII